MNKMNKVNNVERGVIKQIDVKNFMTYDNVTIKPGRHLNLIIGPNGSGKSTIVCALVIGLGGNIKIIGRATQLQAYVKEGKREAKIEIKLAENICSVTTITRIFDINGKSSWMINGSNTSQKIALDKISTYKIQMDNLCQFLPQDRVQDFSKMDAKQLLDSTEKSVGDCTLYEYHEQLKTYRKEHKAMETQIVDSFHLIEKKRNRYNDLKETVSGIKERKAIKKKIISLKQKKAWLLYDEKRAALLGLKQLKDTAEKERKKIKEKIQPIQVEINKIKSDIKIGQYSIDDHSNKLAMKNARLKHLIQKVNDLNDKIEASKKECEAKIQIELNRDNEIHLVERQKSKLENDLANLTSEIGSENDLQKKENIEALRMEKCRDAIGKLTHQIFTCSQQEDNLNRQIIGCQAELESMDIHAKRLDILKQRSIDSYKGVLWLRENKHKFSGTVHEPMLLSINVTNAKNAVFLESVLPFRDLIAFVCENKQDMNILIQHLREQQHLQVNAVHSNPEKPVDIEPMISLSEIQQYGFKQYLLALLDAPPAITKYLVTMHGLHNIPVGSNDIENHVDSIPQNIHVYLSENTLYSVRTSKYTKERSTIYSSLSPNGLLSVTLNKSKIEKIQESLKVFKEKKHNINKEIAEVEAKVKAQNDEMHKVRSARSKYQQELQRIHLLKSRISMIDEKMQNLREERCSVDEIKELYKKDMQGLICNKLQIYKDYNNVRNERFKCMILLEEVRLALQLRQTSLIAVESDSQEILEQYKRAEQQVEEFKEELSSLRKDAAELYNEALKLTDGLSPHDTAFQKINTAFAKLPPNVKEINEELNIAQAKVYCMGKNTDSEELLQEYEKLEVEIREMHDYNLEKKKKFDAINDKIMKLKNKWLPLVTELVEKINHNFSNYFALMNCVGELSLITGANKLDFDQYGLQIKVKFRDTDELQELTRHFQSGGERAVTTAIYMIALQELATVPFRCVDEINQGMDAVNERRIFELLAEITSQPGSSQYFLLTPKLVSDLQYNEKVTVISIFNGPRMISHTDFNVEQYCQHLREITSR